MKNHAIGIVLAGLFATQECAAQEAAELELAKIIAVEEQEHDLDKARTLYVVATTDASLSEAARALAKQRLDNLMARLGQGKGASAQDAQRRQQLQLQARELLKRVVNSGAFNGVDQEQLYWIGEPAIAEVVAVLRSEMNKPYGGSVGDLGWLVRFLWRMDGPIATQFLADAATNRFLAPVAAATCAGLKTVDIGSAAVVAYLHHSDWAVTKMFLRSLTIDRLDEEQIVTVAERGSRELRAFALNSCRKRVFADPLLERIHAMVRTGIDGTDPVAGKAAEEFLASRASQSSLQGLLLVLEKLPELRRRGADINSQALRTGGLIERLSDSDVQRLVKATDACVRAIGPIEPEDNGVNWMVALMWLLFHDDRVDASEHLLGWWDQGYPLDSMVLEAKAIDAENVMDFFQRIDRVQRGLLPSYLHAFREIGLPAGAFEALRELAANPDNSKLRSVLGYLMAATGTDEAAEWLLEQWRNHKPSKRRARRRDEWHASAMIDLCQRNPSEPVREAMRSMIRGFGGEQPSNDMRASMMLALLSVGDEPVLEFVALNVSDAKVSHPYAPGKDPWYGSPLLYLVHGDAIPAHSFSEAQVLSTVRRMLERDGNRQVHDSSNVHPDKFEDRILLLFATLDAGSKYDRSWPLLALERLSNRIENGKERDLLEQWFLSQIGKGGLAHRLSWNLTEPLLKRYRAQLMPLIDAPDETWADNIASDYWRLDRSVDPAEMLKNRHAAVRESFLDDVRDGDIEVDVALVVPLLRDSSVDVRRMGAKHVGAKVCKEAVPGLIELLRDGDATVREAASEALTRIRFYHEQQAHWDRVLKGVDASSASAAEKLLMQAKPDQAKQQRLLAIKSLGVLGVPEALPFLIEWSQGKDADVAKAASDAITQIHLNPRK